MRAGEHTRSMLRWWQGTGVERADLAVRRLDGTMAWHRDQALDALPFPWARAQNVRQADVYIRPARGHSWPLVFLDDVRPTSAAAIVRKYAALVISTSPAGGCHVWLQCTTPLDEDARRRAQRWLADRVGADKGSTSGEHLGRLAGFRNWKRAGVWVNVLLASDSPSPWDPSEALGGVVVASPRGMTPASQATTKDLSASGKEWGWVCGMLEAGIDQAIVYARLVEQARPRRGPDTDRYASRTITRALRAHERPTRELISRPSPRPPRARRD